MRLALISLSILLVVSLSHSASLHRVRRQLIPREFQNLNIENYLKNPRAVAFQLKCIIYDGPCDRIGKYLKVTIPELLTNQCKSCAPEQRKKAGQLVAFIQQNYPREWDDAVRKFQSNRQVQQEDVNRFENLLGIKLRVNGTEGESTPSSGPPPDLKNIANFASKIGTEVSQNVKKEDGAATGGPTEIKSAADFSAALSDLIKSSKDVKPGTDEASIAAKVEKAKEHVKAQPSFEQTTLPAILLQDEESGTSPSPAAPTAA